MIIGISGKIKSGKSTVGDIFKELDPEFEIKRFAHGVKQVASILTGIPIEDFDKSEVKDSELGREWNKHVPCFNIDKCNHLEKRFYSYTEGSYECDDDCKGYITEQSMTVRELLQKIGTDAIRNGLHKDAWVNALMSQYKEDSLWIITDVRFPNEAQAIRDRDGILIRINRDTNVKSSHPSETSLDYWDDWDYEIDNNGTLAELNQTVFKMWNDVRVNGFINVWKYLQEDDKQA